MKKMFLVLLTVGFFAACNNSASDKTNSDTTTNTNTNTTVTDTGMGSSMSDTSHRMDTGNRNNKMNTDTSHRK
jgi:hypothetical protein